MPKYKVKQYSVYRSTYEVEADCVEEAFVKQIKGDGLFVPGSQEFIMTESEMGYLGVYSVETPDGEEVYYNYLKEVLHED